MKCNILFSMVLLFSFISCNTKIDSKTYSEIQEKGERISNLAQATLLGNVGKAIKKGGPEYAVEFCNLKASFIADSLNQVENCIISRVSAKNRNFENQLKGKQEKELWEIFEKSELKDSVIQNSTKFIYYKRIHLAMPACLKCHGNPGSEINSATMEKLQKLYPNDLASGYKLNDFRGLWKIEFEAN